MFSEKLISLLQTFSKHELNRFKKFLLSPYLNDQEDLTRLFDLVNDALRIGEDAVTALEKPVVWKALYSKKPFEDAHLRRMASDLTLLAQRFLVAEARQQDPLTEALDLQKVLEKPELQKHLAGVERQIRKLLDTAQGQSTWYYLSQFRLHWNIYNRASKVVATTDFMEKLLPADKTLEYFYVVQKMKFYIAWLIFRGFRSTQQELTVMPGFWAYLQETRFEEVPLVSIYQDVILCLTEPNEEEHFGNLMTHLEKFADKLAKEDLRECYQIAQNYCAFKLNQGRIDYYPVFFRTIKSTIELGVLLENGQLSEGVYKNIVTVSLGSGEFDWAERFIEENSIYLPSDIRDNARTFNLAYLYFYQKKYNKVIELLQSVEYRDVIYTLNAKLILLQTYYESREYLAMDSLIDSFRIFIRRNKVISKNQKREYNNFLNFVKKLNSLDPADAKSVEKFKQRVMESSSITPKKWLLEKIEGIEFNTKRHKK